MRAGLEETVWERFGDGFGERTDEMTFWVFRVQRCLKSSTGVHHEM